MNGFSKKTMSVSVPRATGVRGFLQFLKELLEQRNVDTIHIQASGQVDVTHWVKDETSNDPVLGPLEVSFAGLMPSAVLSRTSLREVITQVDVLPTLILPMLFRAAEFAGTYPVLLAAHSLTAFKEWYREVHGTAFRGNIFGCDVVEDQGLVEDVMVLFVADMPGETDITQCPVAYKISLYSTLMGAKEKVEKHEPDIVD